MINRPINVRSFMERKPGKTIQALWRGKERREKEEDLFRIPGFKKKDFDAPIFSEDKKNRRSGFVHGGYSGGGMADYTSSRKRQVYFHTTYSYNKNVHKKYLSYYMPQEEKELENEYRPSEIFGTEENEYMDNIVGFHHKIVISPECPEGNFKAAAESFIRHVEMLTGYELLWRGVVHNDTGHRHIHLCINGKDKNGKKVWFDKTNQKNGFRETASYIFTLLQGERTDREIEAAKSNVPKSMRWTHLDERISDAVSSRSISPDENIDPMLRKRLDFLCEIRLCTCDGEKYIFDPNWKEVLVNTGRYNTYMREYLEPDKLPLKIYNGGFLEGKVEKVITFDRDESFNNALIVSDGVSRHYVAAYDFRGDPSNLLHAKVMINVPPSSSQFLNVNPRDIEVLEKEKKTTRRRNVATNTTEERKEGLDSKY